MDTKTEQLIANALQMPEKDRATIAKKLITSLESHYEIDTEKIWQKEIQKRISDIDSGHIDCIPWEDVRARLRRNTSA